MEQRHITGKSHWYHETQSSTAEYDVLASGPGSRKGCADPFRWTILMGENAGSFLSLAGPRARSAVESCS